MNSEESEIKTEFNFLKFMEDWKPPADVSVEGIGMISRNNQKGSTLSQVNETENSKEFFDASKSPIMKLEIEAKQEIKEESMDEDFLEQNSEEDNPLPISDEPKVQEMVGVQKRKSKKSCNCDICDKDFISNYILKRHIDGVHLKKKDHKCFACGKGFSQKVCLNWHLKNKCCSKYKSKKSCNCDICGKDFLNHENMKRHIDGVHLNKKDHKCSECGKGFSQKKDLNWHLKNKSCSIHKHLLCELCGKSFGQKITLYRHIRFIHEGLKQ